MKNDKIKKAKVPKQIETVKDLLVLDDIADTLKTASDKSGEMTNCVVLWLDRDTVPHASAYGYDQIIIYLLEWYKNRLLNDDEE